MKKLLLVLLILSSTQLFAQLRVGVVSGINSSSFKTESIEGDMKGKVRFTAGVDFDYNAYDDFHINLKTLYKKIDAEITIGGQIGTYESSFFEIPLTVKYEYGDVIRPYLMAGVSLNLCSDAKVAVVQNGQNFTGDFNDRIKDLTFSYVFGGGIAYKLDGLLLFVEANYSIGAKNILDPGTFELRTSTFSVPSTVDDNDVVKINNLTVMAGIALPVSLF